jgi:LL-diaminopimelate aminotransferase
MASERLKRLPEYLFAQIDEAKKGREDLIDLSIGDPDQPTPEHIREALKRAIDDPKTHTYPPYNGYSELRIAIADWYRKRFGVELDPETEVLPLIGSKEGIAHITFSLINPGDRVLVPDPAYPVYHSATILAGGVPVKVPLLSENRFLPDLASICPNGAKLFFLNYPNNPTSACCDTQLLKSFVDFAKANKILICFDSAYSEIYFEEKPPSILKVEGAKNVAVEFHSFSKTYNMAGWRIGFCVGNQKAISALLKLKENLDSGIFGAVQYAAISALKNYEWAEKVRKLYQRRRDVAVEGLKRAGFSVNKPKATFFVWLSVKGSSLSFCKRLIEKAGVALTPGIGFGEYGEGFVRISLTCSKEKIEEATERIAECVS